MHYLVGCLVPEQPGRVSRAQYKMIIEATTLIQDWGVRNKLLKALLEFCPVSDRILLRSMGMCGVHNRALALRSNPTSGDLFAVAVHPFFLFAGSDCSRSRR